MISVGNYTIILLYIRHNILYKIFFKFSEIIGTTPSVTDFSFSIDLSNGAAGVLTFPLVITMISGEIILLPGRWAFMH
jgi:hypothetical protein